MPLLPEEFESAKKEPCAHLPADDVRPLVDQYRQVAIALHPLRVHGVDDRLRSRTDDERLFKLFAAAVGDDGGLGCETFDVLGLLVQKTLGNEEREVRVLVAGVLEHRVELVLHPLPDPVTARPDHHATANRRVIGELGAQHDLVVPGAEVFGAFGQFLVVGHWRYRVFRNASRAMLRSDPSASVFNVIFPFA